MSDGVNSAPVTRPGISEATLLGFAADRHQAREFNLLGQRYCGLYIPYGVYVEGKPFGRLRLDQPRDGRKYTQRINTGATMRARVSGPI